MKGLKTGLRDQEGLSINRERDRSCTVTLEMVAGVPLSGFHAPIKEEASVRMGRRKHVGLRKERSRRPEERQAGTASGDVWPMTRQD